MNIAQMIRSCSQCGRGIHKNPGGRPVDPNSKRQRILSFLDDRVMATTTEIAIAIGAEEQSIYCTLAELRREEKIARCGKDGRKGIWKVVD